MAHKKNDLRSGIDALVQYMTPSTTVENTAQYLSFKKPIYCKFWSILRSKFGDESSDPVMRGPAIVGHVKGINPSIYSCSSSHLRSRTSASYDDAGLASAGRSNN